MGTPARTPGRSPYDWLYRLGLTPWERAAHVQADLVERLLAQEERDHPGRSLALDLGCGTGRHTVTLARRGWQAWGVDASTVALEKARARAAAAGVHVRFDVGDVRRLGELPPPGRPVSLVIDVGCFHGLDAHGRRALARDVTTLAGPDATMLLVAMHRRPGRFPVGATADELRRVFTGWVVTDAEPLRLIGVRGPVGRAPFAVFRLRRDVTQTRREAHQT